MRISSVRSGQSGGAVLEDILQTDGFRGLYKGLAPLLLKEVPFVVTKFVVFDSVID